MGHGAIGGMRRGLASNCVKIITTDRINLLYD